MSKALCFVIILFSNLALSAPLHNVSYNPATQQVEIQTELCLYGRGIQQALVDTSFNNLANYLRVQYRDIAAQISDQHNLKQQQKTYIEYLLTLKLAPGSLTHQYSFVGNDTCTKGIAKFALADAVDFSQLFSFDLPDTLHFVSSATQLNQTITQKLQLHNLSTSPQLYANHVQIIDTLQTTEGVQHYYSFALSNYINALTQSTNSVFIIAEPPYFELLSQYLQANNFAVQNTPESAHWTIRLNAKVEQQKYLSLHFVLNNKNQFEAQLNNNPRQLPATSLSNELMLEKFFNVHLELLALSEWLRQQQ